MLAARFHGTGRELVLDELPVPRAGPGECVVQVSACGICGTDLHVVAGSTEVPFVPVTLGHEAAGVVVEVGAGVGEDLSGRRVVINPMLACLECIECRRGRSTICGRRRILGVHLDGAFAEYVRVPAANVVPIADELSLLHAALIEPMATPFHALTARAHVRAGDAVAIIGVGGLGLNGVQIARLLGACTIIAVDTDPAALQRATALGATHVLDPLAVDVVREIRRLTDGGVDVALECVGRAATVEQAIGMLRRGGCAAIIGLGDESAALPPASWLTWREVDVKGVFAYTQPEMEMVARCLAGGGLDATAAISSIHPLRDIGEAFDRFRTRAGSPVRVLVRPGSVPEAA